MHRKVSPKRTNSSRRGRKSVNPVQTQRERRSVQAGSNKSGLRKQPPATLSEEVVTFQELELEFATSVTSSKRRSSTAPAPPSTILRRVHSSRVSKAREQAHTQVWPETAYRDDARQSPRKGEETDQPTTARGGENSVNGKRMKQHIANAPVRRSPRILEKPDICYPR